VTARRALLLTALLALPALWLGTGRAGAADPAPAAAPATAPATPTPQARWGWSTGIVAANMSAALAPTTPVQVALPEAVAKLVKGPTAILYFSPTCPHCMAAMPELNALAKLQPDLSLVGVAVGSAQADDLAAFEHDYQVHFPVVVDTDHAYAWATGARGTPSLLLVEPAPPGTPPTSGDEVAAGRRVVTVTEAFMPYGRGTAPIIALRRNALGARKGPDGAPLPADPFRDFSGYQGTRVCAACHADEAASWAITHHAGAYMSLYTKDRAMDEDCVRCHVVGMGSGGFPADDARARGGFQLGDHSSPLADVGCEACHGPSGPHDGDPAATAAGGDATAACAGCHDAEHSVAFTVDKAAPFIDHFASVGMSQDELRDRLDELAAGTAPRPMLAFPQGETVGEAACRSCHKAEHKDWSHHPHAQAMTSLGEDAGRVECATCHATAARYGGLGTAPATLADLRTDEGVGCEACHGPGAAHAADPRLDNILRLGKTCPECVLEGMCTSCHSPQWDANWDMATRLQALSTGH